MPTSSAVTASPIPNWRRAAAIRSGCPESSLSCPAPAEVAVTCDVLDQPKRHSDACSSEPVVPVHPRRTRTRLAQPRADKRTRERAQVDPHVEDRKACVASGPFFTVEVANDGADVRFEETGAQHDEQQADVERQQSKGSRGCSDRMRSGFHRTARRDAGRPIDPQSTHLVARARTPRTCRAHKPHQPSSRRTRGRLRPGRRS